MRISLDKFLREIESLSPGFLIKIKNLYPLDFNVEIDSVSKFSISLNNDSQNFSFIKHPNPNFSLQLNIFTALNALNNKQIPTKSISGDVESAVMLLGALASIDIDLELSSYLSINSRSKRIDQVSLNYKRRSKDEGKKLRISDGWHILKRLLVIC